MLQEFIFRWASKVKLPFLSLILSTSPYLLLIIALIVDIFVFITISNSRQISHFRSKFRIIIHFASTSITPFLFVINYLWVFRKPSFSSLKQYCFSITFLYIFDHALILIFTLICFLLNATIIFRQISKPKPTFSLILWQVVRPKISDFSFHWLFTFGNLELLDWKWCSLSLGQTLLIFLKIMSRMMDYTIVLGCLIDRGRLMLLMRLIQEHFQFEWIDYFPILNC